MVEGTGLENQRWKHPQVRILSFPPSFLGGFMKKCFDADKYLKVQKKKIEKRIKMFDKLYIEFGGKLIDDQHAARTLPGFLPDLKIRLLQEFKDDAEISEEYSLSVLAVSNSGLMNGDEKGCFNPKNTLTRAEAATTIARLIYK